MAIDARRRAFDSTKSIADVDDGSGGDVVDDSGFGVGGLRGGRGVRNQRRVDAVGHERVKSRNVGGCVGGNGGRGGGERAGEERGGGGRGDGERDDGERGGGRQGKNQRAVGGGGVAAGHVDEAREEGEH